MPKIQWTNLPPALREHLFDRLRERQITAEDVYQLKLWRESEPEAPDGDWYKDLWQGKVSQDLSSSRAARQGLSIVILQMLEEFQ